MKYLKNRLIHFLPSTNGKLFWLLLFVVTFTHSLLLSTRGLNCYDEGLTVYGASQILAGKILYKDIWSNYAPGQYYLLALTFKIFGQSMIVERVLSAFVNSSVILCVYLIAHKLVRDSTALFSWFFALAFFCRYTFYGSISSIAFLLCLLSCLNFLKFFEAGKKIWLLFSGIFVGLAALFRHDFGAYVLFSECVVITLSTYQDKSLIGQNLSLKLQECLKACLLLFLAPVIFIASVSVYFLIKVPTRVLFEDLILFPFTVYSKVRNVPWPFLPDTTLLTEDPSRFGRHIIGLLPSYLMLAVLVLLASYFLMGFRKKTEFKINERTGLLLLAMLIAFFNYSRVLSDIYHMMPQILIAIIVLPWLCRVFALNKHLRFYAFFRKCAVFLVIVAFVAFAPMFLRYTGSKLGMSEDNKYIKLKIDRARHIEVKSANAENLQQAVAYVKDATDPQEKIFVGVHRHDIAWANEPLFYFLAERHNATIFNDMHPGLVTTERIQKKIAEDLIHNKVRYIVLTNQFREVDLNNESNENNRYLDCFIQSNYNKVQKFGHYTIFRCKKDYSILSEDQKIG